MKKAIHCAQKVDFFHLNAFDVGANKEYINKGLMEHELTNNFSKYLRDLEGMKADGFAIHGELLDRCAEIAPELLVKFHKIAADKKLIAVPYYGSHIDVLSPEEFSHQLELQQKAYKEHFGKTAELYLGKVPKKLKGVLLTHGLKISNPKVVGHEFNLEEDLSEMQEHTMEELAALYPHIIETRDQDLIKDWRTLTNISVISSMHEDSSDNPYDNYVAVLNICNDIAHRIKNFKLSQKGEFLSVPEIVSSPSALLSR